MINFSSASVWKRRLYSFIYLFIYSEQSVEAGESEGEPLDEGEACPQPVKSSVERARQRREEEERRLSEHQKNASLLKLKQLDEKINAKKGLVEKVRKDIFL